MNTKNRDKYYLVYFDASGYRNPTKRSIHPEALLEVVAHLPVGTEWTINYPCGIEFCHGTISTKKN